MEPSLFGSRIATARLSMRMTQKQFAKTAQLHQSMVSEMEMGKRLPTIPQLLGIANVLKVPIQFFLTGLVRVGNELFENSMQLHQLGIVDLHVENEQVPGAFRLSEEVIALAVSGNAPSPRIIEAMPAILAWNLWKPWLLEALASDHDERGCYRLGWLADIALTIHRNQGFPGGCKWPRELENFIELVSDRVPKTLDSLGCGGGADELPLVSRRWNIHYPAALNIFKERAERLYALRGQSANRTGSELAW